MRKLYIFVAISIILSLLTYVVVSEEKTPEFNLKTYYLVFLKTGPNRNQPKEEALEIQKGHLANIKMLAELGKIVIAGPLLDDSEVRGIFIFDSKSKEEVEKLCSSDPAVKSGRLIAEVHPWMSEPGNCLPE